MHSLGDDVLLFTADEEVAAGKPGAEGIPDKQGVKLPTVLVGLMRGIHDGQVPALSKDVQVVGCGKCKTSIFGLFE